MAYRETIDSMIECCSLMETRYRTFLRKYAKYIRKFGSRAPHSVIRLTIPAGSELNLLDIVELSFGNDVSINIDIPLFEKGCAGKADLPFISELLKLFTGFISADG